MPVVTVEKPERLLRRLFQAAVEIINKKTPKATGKNSQVKRLQALSRRVEFLWDLVQQRLMISEREIRRDIAVWGADDLPEVKGAVSLQRKMAERNLGLPDSQRIDFRVGVHVGDIKNLPVR